jgi:hypothetical protein
VSLAAYLAASAALIVVAVRSWRSGAPGPVRVAVVLLTTVLVDPHLNVYDLVVLAPMFLLVADWIAAGPSLPDRRGVGGWLAAAFALPLLGPAAAITHVQLSVLAMAGLAMRLARVRG